MSGPLLVCLPLYRSLDVEVFIRFLNMGKDYVSGVRYVRKMYLAASMQKLVEDALNAEEPWQRLVVYEADMLPPVDGFDRIATYPDHLDIVGSVYFQHPPPHNPVIYTQDVEQLNKFRPLYPNQMDIMMDKDGHETLCGDTELACAHKCNRGVFPVDAVGMGFTSIHRRVIENWDPDIPMWGGEMFVGHDLWMTWKSREQGFNVSVDTALECKHITAYPIGYADYRRAITELALAEV